MGEEEQRDITSERDEAAGDASAESPPAPAPAPAREPASAADDASAAEAPADAAETAAPAEETADQKPASEEAAEDDIEVSFEVANVGPCRKKIAVTVGHDVFEKEMDKQLTELAQTVVTPGFRKGRAPRRIIERRYGKALSDQVKQNLAARGIQKSITEANLQPIGEPEIGEIVMDEGGPLTVDATTDVRPTVDLKDYTGLELTKRAVSVGEKDIDQAVRALLERGGRLVPVADPDAAVEDEDLVVCDYRLTCGDQVLAERTDVTVPMQLRQWPEIPELGTERLLGAKAEHPVETTFELGNEKWPEDLRGQQASLSVTIHEIKRLELPDLTDDLLRDLGADSEEDLRARLEIMLLRDLERQVQGEVQEQLERQLLEQADFELPESLVAEQAARSAERARLRLMEVGIDPEEIDRRADQIGEASRERAERDLKMHFILDHVAEREKITADPRDLEERLARIAAGYGVSPRQTRLWLEKDGTLDSLRMMIREQKTTDWLIEQAAVTELEPDVEAEAEAAPEGT